MPESNQGSALDRFLRLFTDVKAGEGYDGVVAVAERLPDPDGVLRAEAGARSAHPGRGSAELKSYMSAGAGGLLAIRRAVLRPAGGR